MRFCWLTYTFLLTGLARSGLLVGRGNDDRESSKYLDSAAVAVSSQDDFDDLLGSTLDPDVTAFPSSLVTDNGTEATEPSNITFYPTVSTPPSTTRTRPTFHTTIYTTKPTTTTVTPADEGDGMVIIYIVIGVVIGIITLCIVVGLLVWCCKRGKDKGEKTVTADSSTPQDTRPLLPTPVDRYPRKKKIYEDMPDLVGPNHLDVKKIRFRGPLKIPEVIIPVIDEPDDSSVPDLRPDEHFKIDEDLNEVVEIGSEVELVVDEDGNNTRPLKQPRPPKTHRPIKAQPGTDNPNNLKPIRD